MPRPITKVIADTCKEYARLEIDARLYERQGYWKFADTTRGSMRFLYDTAVPEARPALDAIKTVMEIDTATTDLYSILWRASLTLTPEN